MSNNISIKEQIEILKAEIDALNEECAQKMTNVIGDSKTRILSYSKQQELDNVIAYYTKKIAVKVVDLEELEKIEKEENK